MAGRGANTDYSDKRKLRNFRKGVFITSSRNPFFLLKTMRPKSYIFLLLLAVCSCTERQAPDPWGTSDNADGEGVRLGDIMNNGELIMATVSGPDTYYEYRGRGMGLHYLLCERFCSSLGVSLRVEVCKDTAEMVRSVVEGEADIAAIPSTKQYKGLAACGEKASGGEWHWLVNAANGDLAGEIDSWLTAEMVERTGKQQAYRLSAKSITRHVYAPMQNRAKGIISNYDDLFRRYAPTARWDWRLLAAQCYQESTFDPRAHSWAGACGLMQIMPSTADHLRLSRADLYNPDKNVAAAAKYIAELSRLFADIDNPSERVKFVLAAYNGGHHHIRDAMALTKKYGGNERRWSDVRTMVLRLSKAEYYTDPAVKYGYMRGGETAEYVDRITDRWAYYRGEKATLAAPSETFISPGTEQPHPSKKRKAKYNL